MRKINLAKITRMISVVALTAATLFGNALAHAQTPLEVEYVRPGVDFGQYTQINLSPLDVTSTKLVPAAWDDTKKVTAWNPSKKVIKQLQSVYHDTVKAHIEANPNYKVVPFTGPKVLEIEVKITRVTPYTTDDKNAMVKGSGEISVQVELIDGKSGDLLAIVAGDQQVGEGFKPRSMTTDRENLKALFATWGDRIVAKLSAQ